mgnify:CR=1 FL=1
MKPLVNINLQKQYFLCDSITTLPDSVTLYGYKEILDSLDEVYTEEYTSGIIFNVSNKNKEITGSTGMITTASDAQASTTLANNFKTLIQTFYFNHNQ